jgi:nucleoside-triphosphatase THEP1
VPKFEEVALPLLALDNDSSRRQTVFVVDEIGKMEVTSKSFVRAIQKIIESNLPLVATVAEKGSGFIEEIKAQGNIYTVTKANRNEMVDIVYRDLQHMLNLKQT